MYKIYLSLVFTLLLFSCDNSSTTTSESTAQQDSTVTENITPEMVTKPRQFEGKLIVQNDEVVAIEVKEEGQSAIFQKVNTKGMELHFETENDLFQKAEFKDLNFDGHLDMLAANSVGNANIYYAYWIFNPSTNLFEPNKEMELCLPSVDEQTKRISSNERSSAAEYFETFYEYRNGHFVMVRREERVYEDEKTYNLIVTELQSNGIMKEIENKMVKEG